MKNLSAKFWVPLLSLIVVVVICAVWYFSSEQLALPKIRRIVLISLDTCRADYLSCYGYERQTTPNIDAVAEEGVLFENVISPIPQTLPAHISMLTGTVPLAHGVHDNHDPGVDNTQVMIAELLKEKGFSTGAVISAFVLDSQTGLDQGFDTYSDHFQKPLGLTEINERGADEVTEVARQWLQEHKDEEFFLFLHYYDPHYPYEPPEPFSNKFADDLYAGEIAYTDHCIGKVLQKMKDLQLYDSSLIIITGDHGEMLGEHGEQTHAYYIYQSAIKVPLIFKLPGRNQGKTIPDLVGLVDIVPTICALLEMEEPQKIQGHELSDYLLREQPLTRDRYVLSESMFPTKYGANPLFAVMSDRYKYIQTTREEFYDLVADKGETNNLIEQEPHQARIFKARLHQIMEQALQDQAAGDESDIDEQTRQRLQSLGYVDGSVSGNLELDPDKDDPKNLIELHTLNANVTPLINQEKFEQAEVICREMLLKWPQFYKTHLHLAKVLILKEEFSEAIDHLQKVLRHEPDQFESNNRMGMCLIRLGRYDQAFDYLQKALQLSPDNPAVLGNLGTVLYQQKKHSEAIPYLIKALQLYPDHANARSVLLWVLVEQDRVSEAIQQVEQFVELAPEKGFATYNELAIVLGQLNRPAQAATYFQKALHVDPGSISARVNLAQILSRQGQYDQAIGHYHKLLEADPDQFQFQKQLGLLFFRQRRFEQAQTHLKKSVLLNADQPDVLDTLGRAGKAQGQIAPAIDYWEKALDLREDWPSVLNSLAWIKATSPDPLLHRPEEAVQLARRACELAGFETASLLDTLAAAHAAAGNFPDAVAMAEKALRLVREEGKQAVAAQIERRLKLYKLKQPYREPYVQPEI